MKISLWQQFSSNHSANFMTVGRFESAEWADVVAEEIREIIRTIGWWRQNIGSEDNLIAKFPTMMANPEIQAQMPATIKQPDFLQFIIAYKENPELAVEDYFQQKYHLSDWRKPLDWINDLDAAKNVEIDGEFIMLSAGKFDTWAGPQPFHAILEQLGGKVASELEGNVYIAIHVRCTMPTSETAENLINAMLLSDPPRIRVEGIPDAFIRGKTALTAQGNQIQLKNYDAWYSDDKKGITFSFVEILHALLGHFVKHGGTDITYSFSDEAY